MPRIARKSLGNVVYHVINRGNAKATVFHKPLDYQAFLRVMSKACDRYFMRLLGWCLMPNHFHLVLWPRRDGDMAAFMRWLSTTYVRRYHEHYGSSGHIWQGRYKSFPCQSSKYVLNVLRYVEQNPVHANMVENAESWDFSSARHWGADGIIGQNLNSDSFVGMEPDKKRLLPIQTWLETGPVPRPEPWSKFINEKEGIDILASIRKSIERGAPYGSEEWVADAAKKLGLESTLKKPGRPKGSTKEKGDCPLF